MSLVKQAHTVPRTYLSNFSRDGEFLWAYIKETGKTFKTNIGNISTGKKFYNLDELGFNHASSTLEDRFGKIEGKYSFFYDKLKLNNWTFDSEIKDFFIEFLSFQLIRTRAIRKGVAHLRSETEIQLLERGIKKEELHRYGI